MRKKLAWMFFALCVLAPAAGWAQGVRFTGTVTGTDGSPVVGALVRVEALAQATSVSGSGKSKKNGRYGLFVMHPARQYRILVTKDGYKDLVEEFDAGSLWTKEHMRVERDFVLEPGTENVQAKIPDDVSRLYNKGVQAYNERDWPTARERFENTLKIRPRLVPAHTALARTCAFLGDNEQALASAERAVELAPGDRDALDLLIKIHRGLGNDERADELQLGLNPESE